MKKSMTVMMVVLVMLALTACGAATGEEGAAPGGDLSLSELAAVLLENSGAPDALGETEITADNCGSYLFIEPVEGAEGLASEAMINAIAHSLCIYRVPEDADAAAIAQDIRDNADPRKWICVEAESVQVLQKGNLIVLVMSSQATADAVAANFAALGQ